MGSLQRTFSADKTEKDLSMLVWRFTLKQSVPTTALLIARCTTNGPLFTVLSPAASGLKQTSSLKCGQLSLERALLNAQGRVGYFGIRVGEAQDLPHTELPDATHRRINEAGDSVPRSQDSVTRAVQNLRISGLPCISGPTSPAIANNGEFQETAAAETTAQGGQGIPSLCAVRPQLQTPTGRLLM